MKAIVLLSIFVFGVNHAIAHSTSAKLFSYTDRSGCRVSIDLAILPEFLDSSFLKDNSLLKPDTCLGEYFIDEFTCAPNVKKADGLHIKAFSKHKKRQVVFMRVGCEKINQINFPVIFDYVFIIKRIAKNKYVLQKRTRPLIEI